MIVTWLQGHGYLLEVKRDNTANSDYVAVWAGGANRSIYFYNCTGGDDSCHQCADACTATAIQYAAGWNATGVGLDKLNAWNRDKRYLRTDSDTGGAVWAEYDIDVAPGGTLGSNSTTHSSRGTPAWAYTANISASKIKSNSDPIFRARLDYLLPQKAAEMAIGVELNED